MIWSQLMQDWSTWYAALQTTFPQLEDEAGHFLRQSRDNFVAYLADRHHLTMIEADEALSDFLFLTAMRQAPVSKAG